MTYTPSTAGANRGQIRTATFPIPNNPAIGGLSFYQQPFSPDGQVGGYDQIYMGWPSKWTIGTGMGPKGSTVYTLGNNASLTGSVRSGYGLTMLMVQ